MRLFAFALFCDQTEAFAVGRIIGETNRLFLCGKGHDGQDRAKCLLPHDFHLMGYAGQYCRWQKHAVLGKAPAELCNRPFGQRLFDMLPNDANLLRRGHRADFGLIGKTVTQGCCFSLTRRRNSG